ncbi:MAG TPA: hypothetical protein VGO11_05300 [Chthoniobacteraceae bacterium]|jgi:hypothetical protein|nr:hypothetical protein [Chthoniobacteraceae bacterium]
MKHPLVLIAMLGIALHGQAATMNGNDFALYLSEAKTPAAKNKLIEAAKEQPHIFRYLKIVEMQEVTENGRAVFRITTVEPSSYLQVKFTVSLPVSLALLREEPVSKVGDAIAVSGKVSSAEPAQDVIILDNAIVRQKDRLAPKGGREMLAETNPTAVVYSYTEGPRPVLVEARDRDLLASRDKIMAEGGPKAWFEFLEREIAKRKQQRAAAAGGTPR